MNILPIFILISFCWVSARTQATPVNELDDLSLNPPAESGSNEVHVRQKRTLFLKKKLIGAGLLGLGLGLAKGYKAGYQHSPEVHHVYVAAPPPVRYVEYVEKPVFVEKIVERPVGKSYVEYEKHWSPQHEPLPIYGYP
ncbi:uncharacterized protein LOC130670276 [Microplitis mediator]|uniref:uncharacterized protein LOC130670276 n=1 Tax=Microplitis mediator TaxID=375433 RepID=UPI00255223AC|nr:uncharacterized protein LOC130670276 [Microplitis mediator]XP_057329585.1 uncharacterized protein LOC130670276 [Microplitis mediator]XP_057329586.1 uncharacterized protein LOC130670276 [Microplitis mediator]